MRDGHARCHSSVRAVSTPAGACEPRGDDRAARPDRLECRDTGWLAARLHGADANGSDDRDGAHDRHARRPAPAPQRQRARASPLHVRIAVRAGRRRARPVPPGDSNTPPLGRVGELAGVTISASDIRKDRRFVELRPPPGRASGSRSRARAHSGGSCRDQAGHDRPDAGRGHRRAPPHRRAVLRGFLGCPSGSPMARHRRRPGAPADRADAERDRSDEHGRAAGSAAGHASWPIDSRWASLAAPRRWSRSRSSISKHRGSVARWRCRSAWRWGWRLCCWCSGAARARAARRSICLGIQPVEAIRLLVIFALAAYFARRLEFLRELSEPASPARPWLRYVHAPRWKDVGPVIVSMSLVLVFFFLQKDLGPALVLSFVFLGLYGIARGRIPFVMVGFGMLLVAFTVAYQIGFPATVRQRVAIWIDPWANGVAGGDQIAQGLWALATGATWGAGPGLGSPQLIPAGHTDFVLAAIGEELGLVGLLVILALYGLLCWRCLRIALRAPGDFTALLSIGVALGVDGAGVRDRRRPARHPAAVRRGHAVPELRPVVDAGEFRGSGDCPRRRAPRRRGSRASVGPGWQPRTCAGDCGGRRGRARGMASGGQGRLDCGGVESGRAGGWRRTLPVQPAAGRRGAPDRARHHLRSERPDAGHEPTRRDAGESPPATEPSAFSRRTRAPPTTPAAIRSAVWRFTWSATRPIRRTGPRAIHRSSKATRTSSSKASTTERRASTS